MAHQAGYRCSCPDCGVLTRGSSETGAETINDGFAAHITASCTAGGARYDSTLTRDQRRDISNGIWLCGNHAKLVDSDEGYYTVDMLRQWKSVSQRNSFLEVVSAKKRPLSTLLANDVQATFDFLLACSKSDLSAFKKGPAWPSYPISLNLRIQDGGRTDEFAVSGLASCLDVYNQVAVIAAPGTGKTTTLLQLQGAVLENSIAVALFVPLSEWATRRRKFFSINYEKSCVYICCRTSV